MKRTAAFAALLVLAPQLLLAERWGGRGPAHWNDTGRAGHGASPRGGWETRGGHGSRGVSPEARGASPVTRGVAPGPRSVSPGPRAAVPREAGPRGGPIAPAAGHMAVTRNPVITRDIRSRQPIERVPGHYYFHDDRGLRYWHYYDRRLHWYGFYSGPRFFWLPFFDGFWWWYDVSAARWLYWYDGYWWWNGPDRVVYVYVNDQFVPYPQYVQQVPPAPSAPAPEPPAEEPQAPSAPPTPPAVPPAATPPGEAAVQTPAAEGSTWTSPDGRRMVQLVGPQGTAFLYDESGSSPVLIKALSDNVEGVRFSGGDGQPLQILLERKGGGFQVYDQNGNLVSGVPGQ